MNFFDRRSQNIYNNYFARRSLIKYTVIISSGQKK